MTQSKPKKLNSMQICLVPNPYREGYTEFQIVIAVDDKNIIRLNEVVEDSHFKSLGEYAFESLVRKFRNEMGWRND